MIQDVDRREAYAIPFPTIAPSGHEYLIPTKVFINSAGEFSLSKGDCELTLLKTKLFAGTPHTASIVDSSLQPEIVAVAYIALVLREATSQVTPSK